MANIPKNKFIKIFNIDPLSAYYLTKVTKDGVYGKYLNLDKNGDIISAHRYHEQTDSFIDITLEEQKIIDDKRETINNTNKQIGELLNGYTDKNTL